MWKLIYEDTFGFGEERDPPSIEKTGDIDRDGFFQLWMSVLEESVSGSPEKPLKGFARFTLVLNLAGGGTKSVCIDVDKYLEQLAGLKLKIDPQVIKETAAGHYKAYLQNEEENFWSAWSGNEKDN